MSSNAARLAHEVAAIARRAAARGARLWLWDRDPDALRAAQSELGSRARTFAVDLADADAIAGAEAALADLPDPSQAAMALDHARTGVEAARIATIDYLAQVNALTVLTDVMTRGGFDAIFIADVVGAYDVFRGGPADALREGLQIPNNDPMLVVPAMAAVREVADTLESIVADDLWPLPTYNEMLTIL